MVVNVFFIDLMSLVNFLTLSALLATDVSSLSLLVQCDDGCPFLLHLKHVLSFQKNLSSSDIVAAVDLPDLPPLPRPLPALPDLPPLPVWAKEVPSDWFVLTTAVLLYLSKS